MAKHKGPTPQELYWTKKHARDAFLPPGLLNHGNTCFMNSVLQGLIATRLLADLSLFNDVPDSVQKHSATPLLSRRSPQLTNGHGLGGVDEKSWVDMPIGDRFLDVMYRAWSIQSQRKRENLSPKDLLGAVGRKYDQYLDFAQQDAHEFLRILLDAMRMEEQDVIKKRQPPPPKQSKKRRRSIQQPSASPDTPSIPQLAEEDKLISFVDMIFGGKLTSILVCQKCKHISQTYEDFNDISLSLKPEDYVHGRKRYRLRKFAKKLAAFPSSSLTAGMQIQRSSSVPPSPREREDAQISDKPLPHLVTRRRSMENLQPDQRIPADPLMESGDTANTKETVATESDGSNVIINEVVVTEEKRVEFLEGEKKEKDKEKEKKKGDAGDGWAKFGRRISMTVGLGKSKDRKSSHSSDRMAGTGHDSPTKRKVSADNTPATPGSLASSAQPVPEAPAALPTLISANAPPTAVNTATTTAPLSSSSAETKGQQIRQQQLVPPQVAQPIPVRRSSSSSVTLPLFNTHIQRSKSPKPPKQTPEEQAYLRRILADVVPVQANDMPGDHSSGVGTGNGSGGSPLSRLKQTSHHLHIPGVHGKTADSTSANTSTGVWLPLGMSQFSGLEECLRMFTAVEVLDGENRVGCRRCWKIANGVYEKRKEESDDDDEGEGEGEGDDERMDEQRRGPAQPIESFPWTTSSTPAKTFTEHVDEQMSRMSPWTSVSLSQQSQSPEAQDSDPTTPTARVHHHHRVTEPLLTPGGLPIPSIDISGTISEVLMNATFLGGNGIGDSNSGESSTEGSPLMRITPLPPPGGSSRDSLVVPGTSTPKRKKNRNGSGDGTSSGASLGGESSAEESGVTSGDGTESESGDDESDAGSVSSAISDVIVSNGGGSGGNLVLTPPPGLEIPISHSSGASSAQKPSRPRKKKETILRPAYKRYLISVPPPVLVVHMKRFQQMHSSGPALSLSAFSSSIAEKLAAGFSGSGSGGSNGSGGGGGNNSSNSHNSSGGFGLSGGGFGLGFGMSGFKKVEEFVSFPEWLDLGPFLAPRKEEFVKSKSKKGDKKSKGGGGEGERCMYRLYAVVVHIGNMLGGHYVAYTALPDKSPAEVVGSSSSSESQRHQQRGVNGSEGERSDSTTPTLVPSASPGLGGGETVETFEGAGSNGKSEEEEKAATTKKRQWAYISDTTVRLVPFEEVLNARAYICMYERV